MCKVEASAEEFGQDPCPGTSKYLEVAYKCRPSKGSSFFWSENVVGLSVLDIH